MSKSFLIDSLIYGKQRQKPTDSLRVTEITSPTYRVTAPNDRVSSPVHVSPSSTPPHVERSCGSMGPFCTCCMPKTQQIACQCQMCLQDSAPSSPVFNSSPYPPSIKETTMCTRYIFDRENYKSIGYPPSSVQIQLQEGPPHLLPAYGELSFLSRVPNLFTDAYSFKSM